MSGLLGSTMLRVDIEKGDDELMTWSSPQKLSFLEVVWLSKDYEPHPQGCEPTEVTLFHVVVLPSPA